MGTKILGMLLFAVAIYLFQRGLTIDDSQRGHLNNVRLIGSAVLVFMFAVAFLSTTKSLCEIFGIFC